MFGAAELDVIGFARQEQRFIVSPVIALTVAEHRTLAKLSPIEKEAVTLSLTVAAHG